jgi:hypothetical protein
MLRDEKVYRTLIVGWMVVLLLLGAGCGSGNETSGESDARDGPPDLPITEGCVEACQNFLDVCAGRSRISQARCELGCERDWSEELQTCIAAAPTCGAIETCSTAGEGDAKASDASNRMDVSEGADVSHISDVSDASDVSGTSDVGVSDVSEGTDVSDASERSDTIDGADSPEASDGSETSDGRDGGDGG